MSLSQSSPSQASASPSQASPSKNSPSPSQTLSRGIRVLELLEEARSPLTVEQLAQGLGVHRSIAYRLVRTLEDHGLVTREASGRYALGARLAALAAAVAHDLQGVALPELATAADDLRMTCFLAVLDHTDCITLVSAEPRHAVASVAQRPGARHAVTRGAPGKAILAILPEAEWPADADDALRAEVEASRRTGYTTSHDEVIATVRAVAVPLALRGRRPAAIAALHVAAQLDDAAVGARLRLVADAIRAGVGG
ncbi:MAG TPA: ArsR family transcriptional regulator [Micrococcales bacterium]|uniref:IclR family transcriptional regulator n=1 Tax=Miniimonas arenae TaxID=676201 RepID=UPI000EE52993|nr:helix-turn-helix domain-containing protein [Miniimonas arenae]HCX85783.1 ArsR family transcriptional regulator [Micrococcales bacterium]